MLVMKSFCGSVGKLKSPLLNKAVHLQLPLLLQLVLESQFHMSLSCMREVVLSAVYWQ
jgi:hypothetical protein